MNDSEEIKLAVQEGAIKDIKMNKIDLQEAANEFQEFFDNLLFRPDGLWDYETVLVHEKKIDTRLYPYLKEVSKNATNGWLELPKHIAHGYMLYLANSISKNRNILKLTNNPDIFAIMSFFENDGMFDEFSVRDNGNEYYASFMIPHLIPDGIYRIDMEKVLRYREKSNTGRKMFRGTINNFTIELSGINDKYYAEEQISMFIKELKESDICIKDYTSNLIKNYIPSYVAVGVPTAASVLGLLGDGGPLSTKKILGTIFVSGIAAFADDYSKCKNWKSNTASYFNNLNVNFYDGYSNISIPKLDNIFNEFLND